MTPEQARARARARLRLQQQGGGQQPAPTPAAKPPGLGERIRRTGFGQLLESIGSSDVGRQLSDPRLALQAADDVVRIGLDTASFGGADWLTGQLPGSEGVEAERKRTALARERAGWSAPVLDVTTAVAATPSLVARLPQAASWAGKGLRYGAGAIEGGLQTALSAFGHGEENPAELLRQGITGTGLSAAGQALGGKVGSWLERRRAAASQAFKKAGEVKDAATAKYKQVEASGAHYPMAETDTLLQNLDNALVEETATPGLDDRAIAVVERLRKDWAGKPISPSELDKVRQWIDRKLIAGNPRGPDAQLGYRLKKEIDGFATRSKPIDLVSGQPNPQAIANLEEARSLYARGSRSADVEKAAAKAKKQAKTTGSAITGGNIENTSRQQFEKLQTRIEEGRTGGWSRDELARIKQIAAGTVGRNVGRLGGVISPFRGSIPLLAHAATGGMFAPLGIAGEVAAQLGRRATAREIEELAALVRDPGGKGLTADPAKVQQIRDLLARVMTGGQRAYQVQGGP
jgi:hypothetical protein